MTLPDTLAGRLEGKSSLGRLGLLTHSTAGFIDPGFTGHITLELSNAANLPITLWPGMKVGQLCLFRLTSASLHPYGSAELRLALSGPARPDPVPVVPELPAGRHSPLTAGGCRVQLGTDGEKLLTGNIAGSESVTVDRVGQTPLTR